MFASLENYSIKFFGKKEMKEYFDVLIVLTLNYLPKYLEFISNDLNGLRLKESESLCFYFLSRFEL